MVHCSCTWSIRQTPLCVHRRVLVLASARFPLESSMQFFTESEEEGELRVCRKKIREKRARTLGVEASKVGGELCCCGDEREQSAGRRFYRLQLYTHNSTRHNLIGSQLDTAQLYTSTTRYSTTQHATTRHATIRHDTTLHDHNSTRPQLDTPQRYTDHMAVRLKVL